MMRLIRHQALLVVVTALIFFVGLGNYGLFNNAEAFNTASSAEMFRLGHWVVPTFNENLQSDHPILFQWVQLISFRLFGVSEFSARWFSSVMAIGTTLLTYHLGRKLYSLDVGLLAGLILCTALIFAAYGRAATPDSSFVFLETMAITCYVWVVAWQRGGIFCKDLATPAVKDIPASPPETPQQEPSQEGNEPNPTPPNLIREQLRSLVPSRFSLAVPIYVAMGLAVLTSGLVGLLLPPSAIIAFLLLSLRSDDLKSGSLKAPEGSRWRRTIVTAYQLCRPRQILEVFIGLKLLFGIGVVALIALPWYLTVGAMTNEQWLQEFLWTHHADRLIRNVSGLHWFLLELIWDVVLVHIVWLPWSVFLAVAIYQLWQRVTDDESFWLASDRLLACWIGVWLISLALAGRDLSSAILPISPAVALTLAKFFQDWQRAEGDDGVYSFNICCKALGIAGALMMLGFYIAAYLYFPSEEWLALIGVFTAVAAFLAIKFLDRDQRVRSVQSLMVAAVVTAFLVVAIGPTRIGKFQDSPQFMADVRRLAATSDVQIATYDYFEPSIVYYAGQTVRALKTSREVADFMASHGHTFVITRPSKENELRDEIRGDVGELARHRNFLTRNELILLGRR